MLPVKLLWFLLASFLLAGLFLGIGLQAEASGGSLEVVSQDASVGFSEGVTFSVEVEGDADVVEVKLSFRNANGGPWSYVYLEAEPSPRVQASYLLDTGGAIYVPPQGSIEYFYTVRDAEDNVTKTLPSSTRTPVSGGSPSPLDLLFCCTMTCLAPGWRLLSRSWRIPLRALRTSSAAGRTSPCAG